MQSRRCQANLIASGVMVRVPFEHAAPFQHHGPVLEGRKTRHREEDEGTRLPRAIRLHSIRDSKTRLRPTMSIGGTSKFRQASPPERSSLIGSVTAADPIVQRLAANQRRATPANAPSGNRSAAPVQRGTLGIFRKCRVHCRLRRNRTQVRFPPPPVSGTRGPSASTSKGFLIVGQRLASMSRQFNQTISRILRFSA